MELEIREENYFSGLLVSIGKLSNAAENAHLDHKIGGIGLECVKRKGMRGDFVDFVYLFE